MKLLHLADLHLGRSLGGFSLAEEQRAFLDDVLRYVKEQRPGAVLLAGDIYDRSIPQAEAVELLSSFLCGLSGLGTPALMVAGNHDGPVRLDFLSPILGAQNIHIAGEPSRPVKTVTLKDDYGEVFFVLLPFVRPAQARALFPELEIVTYNDAVSALLDTAPLPAAGTRSVLVTHQFVTAGGELPETSESESLWLGGTASVDTGLFDGFSYAALGHLHKAQRVGSGVIRYAGAPLVYAPSEAGSVKTMTEVNIDAGGAVDIQLLPIKPLRGTRTVTGAYEALMREGEATEDYVHARLTDELPILDAATHLRSIYPRLISLEYINWRDMSAVSAPDMRSVREKPLAELFADFAEAAYGMTLTEEERKMAEGCL